MASSQTRNLLLRYGVIVVLILALTLYIAYRLIDNTVLHAAEWNAKAAVELERIDTIRPIRGDIIGADGSILATNMT
ncbi:MAG: hypothetical protein K2J17_06515, partial [Paramuribaculum sp.]|nr:hypothetical protein [Paramuribaculum sp.]